MNFSERGLLADVERRIAFAVQRRQCAPDFIVNSAAREIAYTLIREPLSLLQRRRSRADFDGRYRGRERR
jgi:hypothetical protein